MRKLVIHAGTHKTGTTSIQRFFVHNRKALLERGICYPNPKVRLQKFSRARNASFLGFEARRRLVPDQLQQEDVDLLPTAFKNFGEQVKDQDFVVVSDEALWYYGSLYKGFWPAVKEMLEPYGFDEITIIAYLRRQDRLAQSRYAEFIKSSDMLTYTYEEYLNRKSTRRYLDYGAALANIEGTFGKENITLRIFDRSELVEGDAVADFCSLIGIDPHDGFEELEDQKNPSLKGNFIEIKRLMNYRSSANLNNIFSLAGTYGSTASAEQASSDSLTYEQTAELLARYDKGNARIAREYFGREDGVLFSAPKPDSIHAWEYDDRSVLNDAILYFSELFVRYDELREAEADALRAEIEANRATIESLQDELKSLRKRVDHMRHPLRTIAGKKR